MDFEKEYKSLVGRITKAHLYAQTDSTRAVLEDIYPSLSESEDERIRKELIDFVNHYRHNTDLTSEQAEWCKKALAWLEKQKESLHISETCKENADSFTDEDEKIRRKMIEHFKSKTKDTWCNMPVKDIISYLEKQKGKMTAEEFESSELFQLKLRTKYANGYQDGLAQKEQKPVQPYIKREYIEKRLKGLIGKEGEYYRGAREELAHLYYILGGEPSQYLINNVAKEEQKPASTEDMPYITDEHFYEREPADSFKYKLAEYMTKCCTKKEGPYGYTYGISAESILKLAKEELIKRGELQKPAEWDEFDEDCLKRAIWYVENPAPSVIKDFRLAFWLNTLRSRFSLKPQPKEEWSEEDEKILDSLIRLYSKEYSAEAWPWANGAFTYGDVVNSLKSLRPSWKPSEQKYDGNMDKECIKLCDILNSIPSVDTFESCCGHLKDMYSVWFFCNDIITISRLGRCVERNYSDGRWELLVDSTDTHPTGVFWLRSKEPFQSYDEMEKSVNGLCNCIQHWLNMKFDSYFNGNIDK